MPLTELHFPKLVFACRSLVYAGGGCLVDGILSHVKSEECRAGGGNPPAVRPRLGVGAAFSMWDLLSDAFSVLGCVVTV